MTVAPFVHVDIFLQSLLSLYTKDVCDIAQSSAQLFVDNDEFLMYNIVKQKIRQF